MLDLTPFGFTPTESQAYGRLLELGPSSGYAVARALAIARANAYQALDGLVTKGAATLVAAETPRRYRAMPPQTLFARIVDAETHKLDVLERQVREQPQRGSEPVTRVRGERAIGELVIRGVVRADGVVRCLARGARLATWAPAVRARAAAGRPVELWTADGEDVDLAVPVRPAATERVRAALGSDPLVLVADGALVADFAGDEAEGIWSDSPVIVGLVEAALRDLASSTETDGQPTG
jgi:sugar-specific transcriptional regulator TrmB